MRRTSYQQSKSLSSHSVLTPAMGSIPLPIWGFAGLDPVAGALCPIRLAGNRRAAIFHPPGPRDWYGAGQKAGGKHPKSTVDIGSWFIAMAAAGGYPQ